MKKLEAVIFDVDGVLVDSYAAHFASWRQLAAEHAVPLTEDEFAVTFGLTSRDIIRRLWPAGESLGSAAIEAIDERKEAAFRDIMTRDFPVMDGAPELLEELRSAGLRLAVGSSGPPENVALVLERLGRARFAAAVHGHDVRRGKPDPQVFLLAAERLGAAPEASVVVEDARAGIQAAQAAGMACVALVSTGHTADELEDLRPDLVVSSLRELSAEILAGLVK